MNLSAALFLILLIGVVVVSAAAVWGSGAALVAIFALALLIAASWMEYTAVKNKPRKL